MTDRELLEAAARAAGIEVQWRDSVQCLCYSGSPYNVAWSPLTDDGDALRLAVALRMEISQSAKYREASAACGTATAVYINRQGYSVHGDDAAKATRYAIVEAAAMVVEKA